MILISLLSPLRQSQNPGHNEDKLLRLNQDISLRSPQILLLSRRMISTLVDVLLPVSPLAK